MWMADLDLIRHPQVLIATTYDFVVKMDALNTSSAILWQRMLLHSVVPHHVGRVDRWKDILLKVTALGADFCSVLLLAGLEHVHHVVSHPFDAVWTLSHALSVVAHAVDVADVGSALSS